MKLAILDSKTLGDDLDLSMFSDFGDVSIYDTTAAEQVIERIRDADTLIINKVKLNKNNLPEAKNLKLICITATGFDNVDLEYCSEHKIKVCNVKDYSTNSVAQLCVAMTLSLACHLKEYGEYTSSGAYSKSGIHNRITPVFHELSGKTWGIIGYGNIGKKVAEIASSFACDVIYYRKTPDKYSVSLDTLLSTSDIISIHLPLNNETEGLIDWEKIQLMKKKPILINVARGAICDEEALTKAVIDKKISGLGVDTFCKEPIPKNHPYEKIMNYPNVLLTPHMAWGAYESRVRCMREVYLNIEAFLDNVNRNTVG